MSPTNSANTSKPSVTRMNRESGQTFRESGKRVRDSINSIFSKGVGGEEHKTSSMQIPHFRPELASASSLGDPLSGVTVVENSVTKTSRNKASTITQATSNNTRLNSTPDIHIEDGTPNDEDSIGNDSILKTLRARVESILPDQIKKDVLPPTEDERRQEELRVIANVQKNMINFSEESTGEGFGEFSYISDVPEASFESDDEEGDSADPHLSEEEYTKRFATELEKKLDGEIRQSASSTTPLRSDTKSPSARHRTKIPKFHNSKTIRKLMSEAIDQRDWRRLAFIKDMFRPGTVSHTLAKSQSEMVWLSDWHEKYECTYAISIDRQLSKVLLCFRGAYTSEDWAHILDYYDTGTSNPVLEDYPSKPKNIRLHAGFYKYLFRVRKDTKTTKYDEIAAKLAHYCELADSTGEGKVRITITGHSLGSALATIFSLYASTEDRFTSNDRAIECVTYGCPGIGSWRFAGAVKHQEDIGKLRIAKFHVKGDVTVHMPPTFLRTSRRGAQYWHSGIDIMLPYIRNNFFHKVLGGQPKPKVTYHDPDNQRYFPSLFRQFRDFYLWNLPVRFWRFALFHTLVEHRKRMALVNRQHQSDPEDEDPESLLLTNLTLKELYEIRHELSTNKQRTKLIQKMKSERAKKT
uniref:Fungal lipase-type domain-containing protein n=1 Tax=Entomoneis paludosa TaxID=265537 RepID=A0A7S2Y6V9_9STRA